MVSEPIVNSLSIADTGVPYGTMTVWGYTVPHDGLDEPIVTVYNSVVRVKYADMKVSPVIVPLFCAFSLPFMTPFCRAPLVPTPSTYPEL